MIRVCEAACVSISSLRRCGSVGAIDSLHKTPITAHRSGCAPDARYGTIGIIRAKDTLAPSHPLQHTPRGKPALHRLDLFGDPHHDDRDVVVLLETAAEFLDAVQNAVAERAGASVARTDDLVE